MSLRRHRFFVCAVAMMLAGFGLARADEPAPLGKNLAGESCRWSNAAPGAGGGRTIQCGADTAPAGMLWVVPLAQRLPDEPAAREAAIVAAAKSAPGELGRTAASECEDGRKLTPDGDTLLFFCVLDSVGWPRLVLVTAADSGVVEAEGLPAMLPVLQAALAASSGRALSAEETEAAIRLVEAKFPAEIGRAGGADMATYKALVELGGLDGAARNYAGAEAAYRRALEIETRLFGATGLAVGESLLELALQVSNQERFDEAADLFRRAEPIIDASTNIAARARLASYRALDAANQRHFGDALKFARAATQMRRAELAAANPGDANATSSPAWSRGELAHSLRIEAAMALRLGDLSTALAAATEVMRIVSDEPSLPLWWRPDVVTMMGEIDARREKVVPAEREFREAVAMEQKLFGDTAPTAFGELRLGQFYADQQVYQASVDAFRPALAILGRDEVARATMAPDQIVPFLGAASALATRKPDARASLEADAFRASQLVGSDVAGQTIARAAARIAAADPALAGLVRDAQDAQRRRDGLRIELAAETAKPDDRRDGNRERRLVADLQAAAAQSDQLAARIRSEFPDYTKLADPGPAELGELQAQLGVGEAFLSFVIGAKDSYALLATSDGLTVQRIAVTQASLAGDVGDLRTAFVPRLGQLPPFDVAASYALYRRVLGPLEDRLHGIDHLVVAPTGALASLPLALLVTAPPGRSLSDAAWLVRRMAVSQVPSARAFLSLRAAEQHHAPAPKPILAIGDPSFAGAAAAQDGSGKTPLGVLAGRCRENGPIPADVIRALPPLKETGDEVRTVARLLGGSGDAVLLGANATERNLRAQPLADYRVLYFATHGLLPGELHCQAEPSLVLSPPATPARSTDEDGLLEASEIAGLKLDADLVVLSACNTAATGRRFGGEALTGLADAFFAAGARAVLASHWEVPSLSTVKLMTGLFQVRAGTGLAQALRQSQLALIADPATAHPYHWAAFAIIGDGGGAARTATAPLPPAPAQPSRGRT